jgi:UTP--glucose-1-phosphate uridylyltransferase
VYAHRFSGKRYDCGSKLGYLQANVELALDHPQLGKDFAKYLKSVATKDARAANGSASVSRPRKKK